MWRPGVTVVQYKFDTKKFVVSLKNGGFTPEQAETVVNIVNRAVNDGIYAITKNLVNKETLSPTAYQQKSTLSKLMWENYRPWTNQNLTI